MPYQYPLVLALTVCGLTAAAQAQDYEVLPQGRPQSIVEDSVPPANSSDVEGETVVSGSAASGSTSVRASVTVDGSNGLSTWYDPYYYGYYGVFYPDYGNFPRSGLPRGYNYFRRWKNLEDPSSMAPTQYPYFYQQHFAAHPEQYFYPYNYYPVYYYNMEPTPYSYFVYPNAPVVNTQPYAPLVQNEEASPVDAKTQVAASFSASQIASAAARIGQKAEFRLVSTDGVEQQPANLPAVDPAAGQTAFSAAYHAYWRQDYATALEQLHDAIRYDAEDARYWYYQGLTELALGEESDAVASFGRAVKVHMDHPEQSTAINRVLERVQGDIRLELHRAKKQAELAQRASGDLEG